MIVRPGDSVYVISPWCVCDCVMECALCVYGVCMIMCVRLRDGVWVCVMMRVRAACVCLTVRV